MSRSTTELRLRVIVENAGGRRSGLMAENPIFFFPLITRKLLSFKQDIPSGANCPDTQTHLQHKHTLWKPNP